MRFTPSGTEKNGPNQVHLHLTSMGHTGALDTTQMALSLGANYLDVGQFPKEAHVVLADPDGNEFCLTRG